MKHSRTTRPQYLFTPSTLNDRPVLFRYTSVAETPSLTWYDLIEPSESKRVSCSNIIAAVPSSTSQRYTLLSVSSSSSCVNPSKYALRQDYASRLPPSFLRRHALHFLPRHLHTLFTRSDSSDFNILISLDTPGAVSLWTGVIRPILDAMGWPEGTYEVQFVGKECVGGFRSWTTMQEVVESVKLSAEKEWEQVILCVGGGSAVQEKLQRGLGADGEVEVSKAPFIHQINVENGNDDVFRDLRAFFGGDLGHDLRSYTPPEVEVCSAYE